MPTNSLSELLESFSPIGQSITIADALKPDMPIVYANKGFENFSGYTREEIIGRNHRFMQGEKVAQESIDIMRKTIISNSSCIVDVLNFSKDGSPISNRLSLRPIFDQNEKLRYYIGIQCNVTILKDIEDKIFGYMSTALSVVS